MPVDAAAAAVAAYGQRVWVVVGRLVRLLSRRAADRARRSPRCDGRSTSRTGSAHARCGCSSDGCRRDDVRTDRGARDRRQPPPALGRAIRTSLFVFENHDGASLVPEICRDIVSQRRSAEHPDELRSDQLRARRRRPGGSARRACGRSSAHVHLKGLDRGEFCEFGIGDVDLTPLVRRLVHEGYTGDFTVEYEGPFDGTVRLYQSVVRARIAVAPDDGVGSQ